MKTSLSGSQNIELMAQAAIAAATSLNWQEAAKINQKILKSAKDDLEALNRLARAKSCLGKLEIAKKLYTRVLSMDPYNIIAKKNLDKISKSSPNNSYQTASNAGGNNHRIKNLSSLFLFEPGKTKIITLLNLAPPAVLATLNCGDQVEINPKSHSVSITSLDKIYLGALPDDLAHRLIAFIAGGNQYEAYIKSATSKILTIFIREVKRSTKFASQPSFSYSQNQSLGDGEFSIY